MLFVNRSYKSFINPLWLSHAIWQQETKSSLVQIMACCLCGTKPSSEPVLTFCENEPLATKFSEILFEILRFSFKKMNSKMCSANRQPFCLGLNVLKQVPTSIFNFIGYNNSSFNVHLSTYQSIALSLLSGTNQVENFSKRAGNCLFYVYKSLMFCLLTM